MQISHKPTKIVITGTSGTGKSTYFTRYLNNAQQDKVFVFDHEGEYSYRTGIEPCRSMEKLAELLGQRVIVYDCSEDFPGDTAQAFNFFSEWVFEISKELPGTKLFASDEMQKILGTDSIPYEFQCVIETGRRRGIDTIFIYQQINLMHNRLRNQLTEIVTFRHIEKRALQFLEEIGFDPDELRTLDRGEFKILNIDRMEFDSGKFTWSGNKVSEKRVDNHGTNPDCRDSQADDLASDRDADTESKA